MRWGAQLWVILSNFNKASLLNWVYRRVYSFQLSNDNQKCLKFSRGGVKFLKYRK